MTHNRNYVTLQYLLDISVDQALLTTSTGDEGTDGTEEVTREEQLQAASAEPVQLTDVTVTTPPDYRTIVLCSYTRNMQFNVKS